MKREVMCYNCGYLMDVDEFWASQKTVTGNEVQLQCPACLVSDKWELVENYTVLGDRDAAILAIRKKYGIPEDLDKKFLISRYNGEHSKPFEGGKFKLNKTYEKLFRINSKGQVVQKFDAVTKKDFDEGKEKKGMVIDLSSKKPLSGEEKRRKVQRLKKYGVEIVR